MEVSKPQQPAKGCPCTTMIPNNLFEENTIQSPISSFLKEMHLTTMLTRSNGRKEKGIPSSQVFKLLFSLAFTGKPFLRLLAETQSIAKDTVYRFLKSPHTNWRRFLFSLSCHVVQVLQPLTSEEREEVLIIDDSVYPIFHTLHHRKPTFS
jgi:hypothetical protein